jgi:PEGA domain
MLRRVLLFLLLILATQSGCATLVHGPTQQVTVTSEPEGAAVSIGSPARSSAPPLTGVTPLTVSLSRSNAHRVEIRKDGYRPQSMLVERVMSAAVLGSVLAAGPIGWGVDALTGAQYRLVPERVHAVLAREEHRETQAPAGLNVPEAPLEELRRTGAITAAEYEEITRRLVGRPPHPSGPAAPAAASNAETAPPSAPGVLDPAASGPATSRPAASGPGAPGPAVSQPAASGPAASGQDVAAAGETAVGPRLATPGLASTWLLGLWATQGAELQADQAPMRIEFRKGQSAITWQSTGHHPVDPGSSADAFGNVVELTESWVELVGVDAAGGPVKYYLTRTGNMLRGYGFLAGGRSPVATALTRIR